MLKNSKILIMVMLFFILFKDTCVASDNIIKINDLIENSISLDTTEVTVQGEVVGEALERGKYAWININDTSNAIGIWVKKSDIDQIKYYGDYKHKGDIVKITGVFYKACSEHGGDVDIHCSNIKIVELGYTIKEQLSLNKIILTLIIILITAVIVTVFIKTKKQVV